MEAIISFGKWLAKREVSQWEVEIFLMLTPHFEQLLLSFSHSA
jgi:hypothetical protein